jgi:hypothetical protein
MILYTIALIASAFVMIVAGYVAWRAADEFQRTKHFELGFKMKRTLSWVFILATLVWIVLAAHVALFTILIGV